MKIKNMNNSNKIINIIDLNNKIDYLKIITNLKINIFTVVCELCYDFMLIANIYLKYNNNILKILKSLNLELILYALKFTFKCYYNNICKKKILQIVKTNNIIDVLKKLYNNNKNNIKLIITLLNYCINKISLHNLFKNKILKIMNIYGNKLTLTEFNYYYLKLDILKSKILNFESSLKEYIIDYLNLKIYSYLLLLLLYISSLTIPLALIAFP